MDDFIAGCVDEVALEGPAGCTLERLWTMIATKWQADGPVDVERLASGNELASCNDLDESLRDYVWPSIVAEPQLDVVFGGQTEITKDALSQMRQEDINAQFPRLRIVASESARQFAIGIANIKLISEFNIKTLVIIARARDQGVTQFELAKLLNMDPRNLFHQIKVLIALKLIVKSPVTIKGSHSNLCLHKRFAHLNSHYQSFVNSQKVQQTDANDQVDDAAIKEQIQAIMEQRQLERARAAQGEKGIESYFQCELVRNRVTVLLAGVANRVMVAQDLMDILIGPKIEKMERKMFNKVLGSLQEKGFIEVFESNIPRGSNPNEFTCTRCVRLLKLYTTTYKSKASEGKSTYYTSNEYLEKLQAEPENKLVLGQGAVAVDRPIEYQVYNIIQLSGTEGTTAAVIRRSLSNLAVRILERILKRLQKPNAGGSDPMIVGDLEFQGRERRYRYFSSENYMIAKGKAQVGGVQQTLIASALDAISPMGAAMRRSTSAAALSAIRPNATSTRKSFVVGSKRKKKGQESEEEEPSGLNPSDDDEVLDLSINVNSPRTLRTRAKPINFNLDPEETEAEPDTAESDVDHIDCSKCKENKDDDKILLCDHCDKGLHTYCADPPLDAVPEGDWFCSAECKSKGKKVETKSDSKTDAPTRKRIRLGSDDGESEFEIMGESSEDEVEEDAEEEEDDKTKPPPIVQEFNPYPNNFPPPPPPPGAPGAPGYPPQGYGQYYNGPPGYGAGGYYPPHYPPQGGYNGYGYGGPGYYGYNLEGSAHGSVPHSQSQELGYNHGGPSGLHSNPIMEQHHGASSFPPPNQPMHFMPPIGGASGRQRTLSPLSSTVSSPAPRIHTATATSTPTPLPSSSAAPIPAAKTVASSLPSSMRKKTSKSASSTANTTPIAPRHVSFQQPAPAVSSPLATASGSTDKPENVTPVSKTNSVLKKHPMTAVSSSNSKKRESVILQMLETKPILDVNTTLAEAIDVVLKAEQTGSTPTFSLDKKTLVRTGKSMESRGLLRSVTVQIPKINGRSITKQLFVHTSLSTTGPEVSQFIDELSELSVNVAVTAKPGKERPIQTLDAPLERLPDIQMKFGGFEMADFQKQNAADVDAQDGPTESQLEDIAKSNPFHFWMNSAKKYGYIMAKVLRVKLIHEWLYHYFVTLHSSERSRPKGVFTTLDVYNFMALDLYLKIVGVTTNAPELDTYLDSGGDRNCSLINLPESVKMSVLAKPYKLKSYVITYLDFLLTLNIVSYVNPNHSDDPNISANEELILNTTVAVTDYRKTKPVLVRNCVIESEENLRFYWLQLELVYRKLLPSDERPAEESDDQPRTKRRRLIKHTVPKDSTPTVSKILTLLQPRNWQSSYLFNAEEVAVLESHVDRKKNVFPVDDNIKIQQIAQELNLAPAHVKHYFYRVQQNYERRLLMIREKQDKDELKKNNAPPVVDDVLKKNRQKVKEVLRRKNPSNLEASSSSGLLVSEPTVEIIGNVAIAKKRVRTIWTLDEDLLLMHGYAILRCLSTSRGVRFSWVPIAKALGIERELCRRRMVVLLKTKLNEEKVNLLVAEWPRFYDNGMKAGDFGEIPIQELLGIDATPHIQSYFQKSRFLERSIIETVGPVVPLPISISLVHDSFAVYPFHGAINKHSQLKESLEGVFTIRGKMSILYSTALLADIHDTNICDNSSDGKLLDVSKSIEKVMASVKSVMITPETRYNSDVAFRLMYQFSTGVVSEALSILMMEGGLVKNKKGYKDRTVPGRSLTLSDKFLSTIAGVLPTGLIPQVLSSISELFESNEALRPVPPLTNGLMCLLLESLAYDVIKLTPSLKDPEAEPEILVTSKLIPSKTEVSENQEKLATFDDLSDEDVDSRIKSFLADTEPVIAEVFEVISKAGTEGVSLMDMKKLLANGSSLLTDSEIVSSVSVLLKTNLVGSNVKVISKVGRTLPLFVSAVSLKPWMLRAPDEVGTPGLSSASFPLRLWYDIHGSVIQSALRACIECVMGHIVESPGVQESNLASLVAPVMNPVELSDILDLLIERRACKKVCLLKPKKYTSLRDAMTRRTAPMLCDENTIDENKVSSYFPLPEWYNVSNISI